MRGIACRGSPAASQAARRLRGLAQAAAQGAERIRERRRVAGSLEGGWTSVARSLQTGQRAGGQGCLVSVLGYGRGLPDQTGLRTDDLSLQPESGPCSAG